MRKERTYGSPAAEKQSGNALVYGIFWTFALMLALGLVLDLGGAFGTAIHDNSMMQVTREETQSTGNGFLVKNSDDPTRALATQVAQSLRDQGFDGEIEIDVWEPKRGDTRAGKTLPADKRVLVYEIHLSTTSPTWALKTLGMDSIPISTSGTWSLTLYSNSTAWRPIDAVAFRGYDLDAGDGVSQMRWMAIPESAMSQAMSDKADQAFRELS